MSSAFQIEVTEPGRRLSLSGVVDEYADLSLVFEAPGPELRLDLTGIERINSFGVRAWIEAMQKVSPEVRLVFERCAPPIIDQINMVLGFVGHAEIESFFAPMVCDDCAEEKYVLFETDVCRDLGGTLPATPCPNCREDMEIDDLEEQYLHFIRKR